MFQDLILNLRPFVFLNLLCFNPMCPCSFDATLGPCGALLLDEDLPTFAYFLIYLEARGFVGNAITRIDFLFMIMGCD